MQRRSLCAPDGRTYLEVRKELSPRWGVVWSQLLIGHAVLVAVLAAIVWAGAGWTWWAVPLSIGGGLVAGYVLHYIVLFQHEAAHGNLAARRSTNDVLANVLIGFLIGEEIDAYRRVHLDHHRYLGEPNDTEHSYFTPLRRGLLESLTGRRVLNVLGERAAMQGAGRTRRAHVVMLVAALVALTIGITSLLLGEPALAVAWFLALVIFLPSFIVVRQVLEHRSLDADPAVDYAVVAHGATNRLFGDGPLASTLGAAGFNRHLLHHWDPGVSYTRLGDLESFLLETPASDAIRRSQTTYLATLRQLVHA
jgi:fatty acid desaturase